MKFLLFFLPAIPATLEERVQMRPIAHRTDKFQEMIEEVTKLAQLAEEVGFEAIGFPEHHLHTEGLEMGSLPLLHQHVIHNTKKIRVGPIGYVLAGWNPLRLALEIAWLDQLTKGRTLVGFARGYQNRWLTQMAQKTHVTATRSDKSEADRLNREVFEEVYQFLRLAWGDKPFRFKGKHYEYPSPYDKPEIWPPHEWTRAMGSPGEVDEEGRLQMIDVVPKPYQKPHPPLFQAFSLSEETVRWCAREGLIPSLLIGDPMKVRHFAEIHVEEAKKAGRELGIGDNIAVMRQLYMGKDYADARKIADLGMAGVGMPKFFSHFGFTEAWRLPEDEEKYAGKLLPVEECTVERQEKAEFTWTGTPDDIRRHMDRLVQAANPEWFIWQTDQGLVSYDDVKRQLEWFGEKIMPHYKERQSLAAQPA
jgi:alkanesulfonate monooxygenase SsuD/methylene tetrahydromethanopterin reductase-like flavin-dependent oxidoreductase (luciferase family)